MDSSSGERPSGWSPRPLVGVALLIFGNIQLFRSFSEGSILGLLMATGVLALAGGLLAPSIAGLVAEPASRIFYPGRKLSRPQPAYSIPRARRIAGRYEEALEELRKITAEHPGEIEAWAEMLDIAFVDLKDGDRALSIYHEGMAVLPTPESREAVGRTFQAMAARHRRRLATEAREQERPKIELPPDIASRREPPE